MISVLRLVALVVAVVCGLMALSLVMMRLSGYHVSGLGGWLAAVCGWVLAWGLTSWEKNSKDS